MKNDFENSDWTEKAALKEADLGSPAVAAAVLFGTRRKEHAEEVHHKEPSQPQDAQETD